MSAATEVHFGLGFVAAKPFGGIGASVPFGFLSDATVNFSTGDMKVLHGQMVYPVAAGRSTGSITGKVGSASFFGGAIAQITGGSAAVGSTLAVPSEAGTVENVGHTVTVTNAAHFVGDFGVYDIDDGIWLTQVEAAPADGEYTVTAGVYTFNTAADDHDVLISYTYSAATTGQTMTLTNLIQARSTGYEVVLFAPASDGSGLGIKFPCAHFTKFDLNLKVGDWATNNLEFVVTQGSTGATIAEIYTGA